MSKHKKGPRTCLNGAKQWIWAQNKPINVLKGWGKGLLDIRNAARRGPDGVLGEIPDQVEE